MIYIENAGNLTVFTDGLVVQLFKLSHRYTLKLTNFVAVLNTFKAILEHINSFIHDNS